jgi:hypothetical protein
LKGERDEVSEELGLSARIVSLEREKTAKEIELDRVKEQHAREKREVEHMVGLHKDRVKQEIELAKREQSITVREENLKADRERFEQQMQFMQKRMETELERLNNLTSEILERLPTGVLREPPLDRLRQRNERDSWQAVADTAVSLGGSLASQHGGVAGVEAG